MKIADFLLFLRKEKRFSVSAVKGYRLPLASVFKYKLPEIWHSFVLHDLIRSFEIERPLCPVGPLSWDLMKVLDYLRGSSFEPLHLKPLRVVMMKTLFLLSLVTVKRVSELQALSCRVVFQGPDISLTYLPEFVAKRNRSGISCHVLFLSSPWWNLWGISLRSDCYVLFRLYRLIWQLLLPWFLVLVLCSCLLAPL